MKAYKIELLVVDHDGLGAAGIAQEIENARYANRCISPQVMSTQEADIGEWTDEHPLNNTFRARIEYARLFENPCGTLVDMRHVRLM